MTRHCGSAILRCAVVAVLLAGASPVHAEWAFSGYRGNSSTSSNKLTVTPDGLPKVTIDGVDYEDRGWTAPRYYGYRVSRFSDRRSRLGFELEFTHAKAISDGSQVVTIDGVRAPLSQVLEEFELSHGLNFALVNVAVRQPLARSGTPSRVLLVGRAGGGITLPHVQALFEGVRTGTYQFGGPAWQVAGGAEIQIVSGLFGLVDLRLTGAHEDLDIGPAKLSGVFISRHFDFGLGWRFGRRS